MYGAGGALLHWAATEKGRKERWSVAWPAPRRAIVRCPADCRAGSERCTVTCEISGWYGVYGVYHCGDSSTFRRITPGVSVPATGAQAALSR